MQLSHHARTPSRANTSQAYERKPSNFGDNWYMLSKKKAHYYAPSLCTLAGRSMQSCGLANAPDASKPKQCASPKRYHPVTVGAGASANWSDISLHSSTALPAPQQMRAQAASHFKCKPHHTASYMTLQMLAAKSKPHYTTPTRILRPPGLPLQASTIEAE